MKQAAYTKELAWLKTNPALDDLCARYPEDWAAVQQEISALVARGVADELNVYLTRLSAPISASGQRRLNLESLCTVVHL